VTGNQLGLLFESLKYSSPQEYSTYKYITAAIAEHLAAIVVSLRLRSSLTAGLLPPVGGTSIKSTRFQTLLVFSNIFPFFTSITSIQIVQPLALVQSPCPCAYSSNML
jgi:hypothetical protein